MALPTDRDSFIQYCLRSLGSPVITIDVSDDQLDDRVDEAIQYYNDYHWDGSLKDYYAYQLTDQDIANKYITIPENIMGIVDIFDIGTAISTSGGMFSLQYQIALNDLYTYVGVDLIPYWMTMENLQFIETILVGKQPIRYNRHQNQLHIDMDWEKLTTGQYIMAQVYQGLDPTTYPDMWKDRWLLQYATALIKRQWGRNIGSKFTGIPLPGGLVLNGDTIRQEAEYEVKELQQNLLNSTLTTAFMLG